MITDKDLLSQGLGVIYISPEEEEESCWLEPVDGLIMELPIITQGERMLLLAGFSLYKRHIGYYAWIISDDPEGDDWDRKDYEDLFETGRVSPIYVEYHETEKEK